MRKLVTIFSICIMASCGQTKNALTYDKGVIINGVKWATRNIDAVGTFAPTPESAGKFYQWNRKKAWNATNEEVADWDSSYPEGTEWEIDNDPSPKGWRVPTDDELKSLLDIEKVHYERTTQNGINGRKFTCKESGNSIFLPAVGGHGGSSGEFLNTGEIGGYWSNTESGDRYAEYLFFDNDRTEVNGFSRRFSYSIRPVIK
jgi:uncharacterized protein (TIGR02145 family)